MADLEEALKKLDRLTQEEARMALAEMLSITHNVRDEVKIVDGKVERVENKVEVVGDKVCDKVEGVGDKVGDLSDKVKSVDNKVQVVIDGARACLISRQTILTSILTDGKQTRVAAQETKLVIQRAANDIDEIKCSWPLEARHCLQLTLNLTCREPVYTTLKILALSCRSIHQSQHCAKGSAQRNGCVAL